MDTQNPYETRGYADRYEYLSDLSDLYGVEMDTVEFASNLCGGPEKDFMLPCVLETFGARAGWTGAV